MINRFYFLFLFSLPVYSANLDQHEEIIKNDEKVQRFLKEYNLEYDTKRDSYSPVYNLRMFLLPKGDRWLEKNSYETLIHEFKLYMRKNAIKNLLKIYNSLDGVSFLETEENHIFLGLKYLIEGNNSRLQGSNSLDSGKDF